MIDHPRSVLIILFGAIGDVVRALPLAIRIKKYWPKTKICWAIEPKSFGIIDGHDAIDKIALFDRSRGFKAYLRFIRELRKDNFDIVFDLQRHFKSGVTSFASRGSNRIGFNRKNAKEFNWIFNNSYIQQVENLSPKIEHYQLFGDFIGLPRLTPLEFGLTPSESQTDNMEQIIFKACSAKGINVVNRDKRVALILGSSWESRIWPKEHYIKLITQLKEMWGMTSFLIGGKSEIGAAMSLEHELQELKVINFVDKTSLSELPSLFSCMHLAIGSDSGPMHIASAVGIPAVSLWGSTSPRRSRPWGNENLVLQSAIGCSPCYRRICPGLNNLCMQDISPSAVLHLIEQEVM
jgi:ADP-heptose:LPS heptosyltransferase